jgi:YD repeat-containing protein
MTKVEVHPARGPSSALLGALLIASLLAPAPAAFATPITSAANIPHSGISPGGVDMATGELILVLRPDLFINGPMPLEFTRYYASMLNREGLASGHLGPNWLGSFDWHVTIAGSTADVITDEGMHVQFAQSPVGGWSLVKPTDQAYALSVVGATTRFTDPVARRIYAFTGTPPALTQIFDEHGNALSLTYAGGMLSQVSDGLGRSLSFNYAPASGLLLSITDGTRTVSFTYTGGTLTGFMDAAGQAWSYGYLSGPIQGLLTGVTEPLGNAAITHNYDALGRVASQSDAAGGVATYAYDAPAGNLFNDPLGGAWTYLHDAQNRLVTLTDPNSQPWSRSYDAAGRLISASRPMGDITSCAYDPASGYPSTLQMADGSAIHWSYGSHAVGGGTLFDLAGAQYPDQTSETFTRDAAGNLITFTDRGGFPWQATYNARGQLLTATNPAGGISNFSYDTQGRPASASDPAGNLTHYAYDALSRLTQVTAPDTSSRAFAYDALDRLTSASDERGKSWNWVYDADGRLTTETDPLLHASHYGYDALDRLTQDTDPLGQSATYAYDAAGRLASFSDRTHRVTQYAHDAWGDLSGATDPAPASWTSARDADLRVTSVQDPLGNSESFAHDLLDRVTHVTDAVNSEFDYGYDSMGRLHTALAPLGHSQTFGYDGRGFLISLLDVSAESDWARTALGDISQFTDPNRNVWPRSHDTQGRLSGASDPLGRSAEYGYDSRSRLTHATLPLGSANLTYDAAGRLLSAAYLDGTTLSFSYDDANRITGGSGLTLSYDEAGRVIASNGLSFTYDAAGRLTSETYGPGKVVNYSYDARGLLSQVTDWVGGATTFSYDAAGRLVGQTRPSNVTLSRTYDAEDRLISSVEAKPPPQNGPISSIAITRDPLGQIAGIQRSAPLAPGVPGNGTTNFSYDAASQVNGLTWDAMGRLLGDGSRSFSWDGASRLTHYIAGAESPTLTYDALGHLLSRTQGATTEQYAWSYADGGPSLDLVSQAGAPVRYFIHTPDGMPLHSIEAGNNARRYYHYDENGNTMYLTDDAATVVTQYAYSPTGEVFALGTTGSNPFTLGGDGGAVQLGGSGSFAIPGGGVYDTKVAREISGGALASGGDMVSAGAPHYSSTSGREDFAEEASHYWLAPDPLVEIATHSTAGTLMHEIGHSIGLDHAGIGQTHVALSSGMVEWPSNGSSHLRLKARHPSAGMADFGLVKTDHNRIGDDRFGGGYSSGLTGGDQIFVDRHGRVKVQFFWDREGQKDPNSSNWIRVSKINGKKKPGSGLFEIEDYSFDVEQVLSLGSQSSGSGPGKVNFNPFGIIKPLPGRPGDELPKEHLSINFELVEFQNVPYIPTNPPHPPHGGACQWCPDQESPR